ncbi:MAG: hypothetical protein MH132_04140 [Hydrotalea sp.]|nr:hypothetical protein [Hydrotalea sp.]
MKKVAIILAFLWITISCQSQNLQIEGGSNLILYPITSSNWGYDGRFWQQNQNDGVYGEVRILKKFNKFISGGIFIGYERKNILSFYQRTLPPSLPVGQPYRRNFIPIGLLTRFNFDESINEFLKSKNEKWIGYIQGGLYILAGNDQLLAEPPSSGAIIQIFHPQDRYGNIYHVFNTGFGYNITKKFYTAAEFGVGALHSAHLTVGIRL